MNKFEVSCSPHIKSPESISTVMWTVVAALIPAGVVGLHRFGWHAGFVMLVSIASAVLTEAVIQKLRGVEVTVRDGSAFVTGLLMAYVLPPGVKWYVAAVGSFVAIAAAKQCFGGLGRNFFNPALVGRAFVQFAFPTQVSLAKAWPIIKSTDFAEGFRGNILGSDAVSGASPLTYAKELINTRRIGEFDLSRVAEQVGGGIGGYSVKDLFFGNIPGTIGEVSAAALILGGLFLLWRGYIKWQVPVFYIGAVALLTFVMPIRGVDGSLMWISGALAPLGADWVALQVFGGGLMLGAFFMATDMVTTPLSGKGQAIFGLGCGVLVAAIRLYGGYPEGVCYSILIMNAATPVIDRWTRPVKFGAGKKNA